MKSFPAVLALLFAAVPVFSDPLTVRVWNAAGETELALLEWRDGELRDLPVKRSTDGADALLTTSADCTGKLQFVVRGDARTSPLLTISSCDVVDTELRPSATIVVTDPKSRWETIAIERCDERRPQTRTYPIVRSEHRLEAVVEAGCLVPTLFLGESAPEPLARFSIEPKAARSIAAPVAKDGGSFRIRVHRDDVSLEKAEVQVIDQAASPGRPPVPSVTAVTDQHGEVRLSGIRQRPVVIGWRVADTAFQYSAPYEIEKGSIVSTAFEAPTPTSLTVRFQADPEWESLLTRVVVSIRRAQTEAANSSREAMRLQSSLNRGPDGEEVAPRVWRWAKLPPGEWEATAMGWLGKGYALLAQTKVTLRDGEERDLELKSQAALVSGRIRTPARPIDGSLRFEPYNRREPLSHAMVPIEKENEFRVLLLPGTYRYGFNPPVGAATWMERSITVGPGRESLNIDLPAGSIRGSVRDSRGTPIGRCMIAGRLLEMEPAKGQQRTPDVNMVSGPDGQYVVETLPSGTWTLTASCGGTKSDARVVTVAEATVEGVDLVVGDAEVYVGVVRTASGRPMARAIVQITLTRPGQREIRTTAMADADGGLRINGPAGLEDAPAQAWVRASRDSAPVTVSMSLRQNFEIVVPE